MTDHSKPVASAKQSVVASQSMPIMGEAIMKSIMFSAVVLLTLTSISVAKELPEAPSAVMAADAFIVEDPGSGAEDFREEAHGCDLCQLGSDFDR